MTEKMAERMATIGSRIKEWRKNKGFTLKELGALVGRTESLVARYEKGVIEIPYSMIIELANALDIPAGVLLYGPEFMIYGDAGLLTLEAHTIAQAYERATPAVRRIVEVALEPFTNNTPSVT